MAKNKKHITPAGQLSPEKYIRTMARKLPVDECRITTDWKEAGICNVMIARRHVTGNLTVGIYLVDLYCLGLKDTSFYFNMAVDEWDYLCENGPETMVCEYTLAHNIIYGAIEFADDYGFKPHKDFVTTQFILEEDDEAIELIDIDFGVDGVPCYVPGPYDNDAKTKSIEATLARTAGPGNYSIMDPGDDFDFDDDEEAQVYDDKEEFWDKQQDNMIKIYRGLDVKCDKFRTAGEIAMIRNSRIGMDYEITGEVMESEYVYFDTEEESDEYQLLFHDVTNDIDPAGTTDRLKDAMLKYPNKPVFYNLLQSLYTANYQDDKAEEIIIEMNRLFPGYLYSKIAYANFLIDAGRANEALSAFDGKLDLHDLFPHRQLFHKSEAAAFWGILAYYFGYTGDMDTADTYMNAILKHDLIDIPGQTAARLALMRLCKLKLDKLQESGDEGAEEL